ncbi:unnamed protein product [Urochloa humidicola]
MATPRRESKAGATKALGAFSLREHQAISCAVGLREFELGGKLAGFGGRTVAVAEDADGRGTMLNLSGTIIMFR